MEYKALYREWRPRDFDEVVGQNHVSITLQNAIESGRVAHAFLFSGPRGTGKTSTAKILAKALNCESGPTPHPCNTCEACTRINQGSSLDVLEIDAASNRGIDEIRDLREKVKFAPSEGLYKVYIIDEVHMLTTEAFNALLKTLEEPPGKVVFILATTEPHKIPATILSRVQRFDFKRIGIGDIVDRLKVVTREFEEQVDEDALQLIARKAEGGMRDALSLLDQCYASGEKLTLPKVTSVLGTLAEEELALFLDYMLSGATLEALLQLDRFLLEGKDPGQIIKELTEHLRNLLILKSTGEAKNLVYTSKEFWPKLIEQSSRIELGELNRLIRLLIQTEGDLRFSTQPRITLEVCVINACSPITTETASVQEPKSTNTLHTTSQVKTAPEQKVASIPKVADNTAKQVVQPPKVQEDKAHQVGDPQHGNIPEELGKPNLASITERWKKVLEVVKQNRMTHAFLVEGTPLAVNNSTLVIGFKEKSNFHKERIEQADNKKLVEEALFSVLGYPMGIKCVIAGEDAGEGASHDHVVDQTLKMFPKELVEIKD